MKVEAMILFWWLMFGGSHIIGSSIPVRNFFIDRLGRLGFKSIYSLVALVTFIPLCYVYFTNQHTGLRLYIPGYFVMLIAQFIMLGSIIVLLQGLVTPNPMTTLAELTGRQVVAGHGIQRVTRHPQNFAFGLFGLAHLMANPYVGDWLFFGGFIIYGVLSAIHQDRRFLATGSDQIRKFMNDTSAMPFAAYISGRQRFEPGEYHPPAMAAAIVLFILLRLLHPLLFGGFGG